MATMTKSDSEVRLAFFELLFGSDQDSGYICIATTNPISPKTTFEQKFFLWPNESLKVENYILKKQGTHNVYFCINLLKEMERRKKHCLPTDLVWADLDEIDPSTITSIPPPIVIKSSTGRWQAFWRLQSKIDAVDAERYSRRMSYSVGADKSGWDLTQLFRVPLTYNYKYAQPQRITLDRALEMRAKVALFDILPKPNETGHATDETDAVITASIPNGELADPQDIIAKFVLKIDMALFYSIYTNEPEEDQDWSTTLWHLINILYRAGMTSEEVFIVARAAKCNKYARDGRPIEHLWRDVLKSGENYGIGIEGISGGLTVEKELLTMPHLVDEPYSESTFIDEYKSWALEATDACTEFHELSAFMVLSSIVSSSVKLTTSYGPVVPNIWGLVLGDSTVTRKTTAMGMAVKLIETLDTEIILATDGSAEGLVTGLAGRPGQVSMFFRDEVSGLFEAIQQKPYLAAMPEILTALYDVPPVFRRLLRQEVIRVENPAFIFFGGGIRDRVYSLISESWIHSGFLPRFLVVSGDFNQDSMRPTGPPTELGIKKRAALVEKLADLYQLYACEVSGKIGGETFSHMPEISAILTQTAWDKYQSIEKVMTLAGYNSPLRDTALPTFTRLKDSMLKLAIILASVRQLPRTGVVGSNDGLAIEVTEGDIIDAAWYVQKWGVHSVDLVLNAGKSVREKIFSRVHNKIKNTPGVLRSTIMQHLHLDKKEADNILFTLEERGMIRKEQRGRGWSYFVI